MRRNPVPPLLLSLLAGACAAQDPADPALLLREALASHQASVSGITPLPAAAGGEGSAARTAAAIASPASGTVPSMAGQVVGHGPAAITAWFGEPRLRREEGNAEIWHYQAEQCHLDLIFYRDEAPGGGLRVAFAAARAVGTTRRGETACLRDISRGSTPGT